MRQTHYKMSSRALDAPSPERGEARYTHLPDTWDGIRFEIGRMCRLVKDGRKEKLVVDAAREAAARYSILVQDYAQSRGEEVEIHQNKVLQAEACDILMRHLYFYVNDPAGIEVIQTPERMVRHARLPIDALRKFMEPFYAALEELEPEFHRGSYSPRPMFIGDCIPFDQPIITRRKSDRYYEVIKAGELEQSFWDREVVSYNEAQERFEFKPITRFIHKGTLPVYKISLTNGTSFRCTENHRLYVFRSKRRTTHELVTMTLAELLAEKQTARSKLYTVACAARIPEAGANLEHALGLGSAQLHIEGLYVAEGWSEPMGRGKRKDASYRAKIGMNDPHAIGGLKTNLAVIDQPYGEHLRKDGLVTLRLNTSPFTKRLATLFGGNAGTKRFPDGYLSLSKDAMSVLVGAYTLGDGFVPTHGRWATKAHLVHNTKSEALARQLRFMHLVLGRPLSGHLQRPWKDKPAMYRLFEYKNERDRKRPELVSSRLRSVELEPETRCCDLTVADNGNFLLDNGSLVHNCDEPGCLYLAMCAALAIGVGSKDDKLCFAFGGDGGSIHHTWARIYIAGEPWNSDFTEPWLRFGDQMEFDDYDELEVPL